MRIAYIFVLFTLIFGMLSFYEAESRGNKSVFIESLHTDKNSYQPNETVVVKGQIYRMDEPGAEDVWQGNITFLVIDSLGWLVYNSTKEITIQLGNKITMFDFLFVLYAPGNYTGKAVLKGMYNVSDEKEVLIQVFGEQKNYAWIDYLYPRNNSVFEFSQVVFGKVVVKRGNEAYSSTAIPWNGRINITIFNPSDPDLGNMSIVYNFSKEITIGSGDGSVSVDFGFYAKWAGKCKIRAFLEGMYNVYDLKEAYFEVIRYIWIENLSCSKEIYKINELIEINVTLKTANFTDGMPWVWSGEMDLTILGLDNAVRYKASERLSLPQGGYTENFTFTWSTNTTGEYTGICKLIGTKTAPFPDEKEIDFIVIPIKFVWINKLYTDKKSYYLSENVSVTVEIMRSEDNLSIGWEGILNLSLVELKQYYIFNVNISSSGGNFTLSHNFSFTEIGNYTVRCLLIGKFGVESKAEVEFEVISTQTPPKVKVWIDKFSKDKEEYTENETISLNATILMGLECVVCPQFLEDFNFSVLIYDANGTVISEEKKSFKISSSNNITNLTFQFKLEHGYYKAKGILSNASGILDEMEIKINITAKVEHIIWIEELTTDKKIYKIGERVNGIVDIRGKFIQAVLKLRVIDDHNEIIYEESKDLIPGKSLFEFELRKAGNFTIKAELRYNEEVMDYKETKIIVRYIEKKHLPTIGIEISTGIGFLSVGIFLLAFIAKTELGKYNFFTFFFVPLYTKLRREKILDHYTRGKIHGYIIANPGEHYNAIKSALGINNGTLAYHLTVLLREGYIVASSDRLYKRFYPVGMKIPNGKQLSYAQKLILEIVKANPGISQIDIANKLNTSIQVINYHIKILVEGNILHVERVGKATKLYLKENNN